MSKHELNIQKPHDFTLLSKCEFFWLVLHTELIVWDIVFINIQISIEYEVHFYILLLNFFQPKILIPPQC